MSTNHSLPTRVRLSSSVAVRPESFGALLYDYDTRRLSFIKDRRLAEILHAIDQHGRTDAAFEACHVTDIEAEPYVHAIEQLLAMGVLSAEEGA